MQSESESLRSAAMRKMTSWVTSRPASLYEHKDKAKDKNKDKDKDKNNDKDNVRKDVKKEPRAASINILPRRESDPVLTTIPTKISTEFFLIYLFCFLLLF